MPTKLVDDRRFHTEVLLEALKMAYDEATDAPPWIRAQLGGRLSIGLCERGRLREQVQKVLPKNSGGVIVRTVGEDVTQETFEREITTLINQWQKINKKTKFV